MFLLLEKAQVHKARPAAAGVRAWGLKQLHSPDLRAPTDFCLFRNLKSCQRGRPSEDMKATEATEAWLDHQSEDFLSKTDITSWDDEWIKKIM